MPVPTGEHGIRIHVTIKLGVKERLLAILFGNLHTVIDVTTEFAPGRLATKISTPSTELWPWLGWLFGRGRNDMTASVELPAGRSRPAKS